MASLVRAIIWLGVLLSVGCSALTPSQAPSAAPPASTATASHKTITVAVGNSIKGFSPWLIGTTAGGARALYEIFTNGLVTNDATGNLAGRLAARMPSFDDGTIVVQPDGHMVTTWTLRPNIKWHDGVSFTADDLVFSWQVNSDPAIPSPASVSGPQIETVAAPDPLTLVITWKGTFYRALYLNFYEFWPYPEHLLGTTYASDKDAFLDLPYWTTQYVQLGAFRVSDFGLGENVVLEAFDDYFLGRPKVDTLIIRTIGDPNTMYANIKAGTVDIISEVALPTELNLRLRDEWQQDGGGTVVQRDGNWFFGNIQYNDQYQRVPAVAHDVRVRQGLLAGIDRPGLQAFSLPGLEGPSSDSFMPPFDPRAAAVGQPFARYPFDPAGALRALADAGWSKAPNGALVTGAGEPVVIPLRSTAVSAPQMDVVAQDWRDLGLQVDEELVPASLTSDRSFRATFPGVEVTAQMNGDQILPRFDGRLCPEPPTFAGAQGGCYRNPALDRLIDQLYGTVDLQQQGAVLQDIGQLWADNVVMLPLYSSVTLAAVRKGVHALDDYTGVTMESAGQMSRNAHLWDID